jgi:TRAP-type mannitol/chloroaromatic compound transport system permease large subunit
VRGSILDCYATSTESAGVGALGATLLALGKRQLDWQRLREVMRNTTKVTAMIFTILIGASLFSLVFRGFGGEALVTAFFQQLPGGVFTAVLIVMLVIFLLGFILDFIEITFVVVPIIAPVLLAMGVDPIWLGVLVTVTAETALITPPLGLNLFVLKSVSPPEIALSDIIRGSFPFVGVMLIAIVLLILCWSIQRAFHEELDLLEAHYDAEIFRSRHGGLIVQYLHRIHEPCFW